MGMRILNDSPPISSMTPFANFVPMGTFTIITCYIFKFLTNIQSFKCNFLTWSFMAREFFKTPLLQFLMLFATKRLNCSPRQ